MRLRLLAALVLPALATMLAYAPADAVGYQQPQVVSTDPVDYTPNVSDGSVLAVAVVGSAVYLGGTFTTVTDAGRSTQLTRRYLFAFDRTTGRVLDFAPALDGAVETIAPAPDGSSIIVGGRFRTVNGTPQRSLAMVAADGSRVTSFTARTNGYVAKVLVRGSRLVAAGRFGVANGTSRSNLAVFDASSGRLDTSFDVPVTQGRTKSDGTVTRASIVEMDADASGSRLVIVGNFRQVAGHTRQQMAMVDLAAGTLDRWYTNRYSNGVPGSAQPFRCSQKFYTQMRDVEFSPDGSYFVVVTTGGAPDYNVTSLCDTAARWETGSTNAVGGEQETWKNCTGGDTLYSVALTGAAVYVGGHERWLDNCGGRDSAMPGSFAAPGIGAIDPATGLAIRDWNPGRTRGVGAQELVANADGLYVGSDTAQLGGEYHGRIGLFPLV